MNKYYVEPVYQQVWCERAEEYVDAEFEGYVVRDSLTGAELGYGETRAEALEAANAAIQLPASGLMRTA